MVCTKRLHSALPTATLQNISAEGRKRYLFKIRLSMSLTKCGRHCCRICLSAPKTILRADTAIWHCLRQHPNFSAVIPANSGLWLPASGSERPRKRTGQTPCALMTYLTSRLTRWQLLPRRKARLRHHRLRPTHRLTTTRGAAALFDSAKTSSRILVNCIRRFSKRLTSKPMLWLLRFSLTIFRCRGMQNPKLKRSWNFLLCKQLTRIWHSSLPVTFRPSA